MVLLQELCTPPALLNLPGYFVCNQSIILLPQYTPYNAHNREWEERQGHLEGEMRYQVGYRPFPPLRQDRNQILNYPHHHPPSNRNLSSCVDRRGQRRCWGPTLSSQLIYQWLVSALSYRKSRSGLVAEDRLWGLCRNRGLPLTDPSLWES
jgi:hypothetical protein